MRSIAADQSVSDLDLSEVFGSSGQVRLLRILATNTSGSIASPEVAERAGLTPSGARKALRRLAKAGLVEKVGTGRSTRYLLKRDGALAQEIIRLFELERGRVEPSWARAHSRRESLEAREGKGDGVALAVNLIRTETAPEIDLDPESPEFHGALVSLLSENLSLINRAREKVLEKLEHRHPGNGHDDWEWRKIFDTYPLPRLLHFLESDSPRAIRLKRSSPFADVLSEREKARLAELVERVH